jgi:ribosome-binding protein aMBF1 (putative translation factor)
MVGTTCVACGCKLDGNPIKVKIGGKSVEVCSDERVQTLKEARCRNNVEEEVSDGQEQDSCERS